MADDYDDYDDEIDEAERRREMYEQLCGTPEQRAAEAREMAERAKQIKRDEVMEWCRQRAEAREGLDNIKTQAAAHRDNVTMRREVPYDGAGQPLPVVTKAYGAPANDARVHHVAAATSREWQGYITRQLDKRDRAMVKAIAQTVVTEEKARAAADAEVTAKLKVITDHIEELRERLDRIEAAGKTAPIRLAG